MIDCLHGRASFSRDICKACFDQLVTRSMLRLVLPRRASWRNLTLNLKSRRRRRRSTLSSVQEALSSALKESRQKDFMPQGLMRKRRTNDNHRVEKFSLSEKSGSVTNLLRVPDKVSIYRTWCLGVCKCTLKIWISKRLLAYLLMT